MSGFMPRHIEQPAPRQSKPAARKTSSRPSSSACAFTCAEPGTTIALTCEATLRPFTTDAASRRSPIREFVHEPMKTRSSFDLDHRRPGLEAHVVQRALVAVVLGLRHRIGDADDHLRVRAPCDLGADRVDVDGDLLVERRALVGEQLAPVLLRPCAPWSRTQPKVVSSGAIMPARPPPSMVMLQIVMRPSIESPRMTSPENSTTWPAAPATPIWPIVARMRSLAVTPLPIEPT